MSWRCVGWPISMRLSSRSSAKMSLRNSSMVLSSGAAAAVAARGIEYRIDDRFVAGAAADVAADGFDHVFAGWIRISVEQGFRRHEHAGRAIAALGGKPFHERFLQRVQVGAHAQSRRGL